MEIPASECHRIKTLLEIDVFGRHGTDPTAAFLSRLEEKHEISETEFLAGTGGYLTALARRKLSGQLNDSERNHIENAGVANDEDGEVGADIVFHFEQAGE